MPPVAGLRHFRLARGIGRDYQRLIRNPSRRTAMTHSLKAAHRWTRTGMTRAWRSP